MLLSQGDLLKKGIKELEAQGGPESPFLKGLRMQLIGFERQERRQNERDQFHLAVSPELKPKTSSDYKEISPEEQELPLVDGFVSMNINIRLDSIKDLNRSMSYVRYHPNYGLLQGWISVYTVYDRGAGGFMAGRGARVKWFTPQIDLFLENINLRKCKGLVKKLAWRVTGSPPVIVGRYRITETIRAALRCNQSFSDMATAERYLESSFVQKTHPILIEKHGEEYRLKFYGRVWEDG